MKIIVNVVALLAIVTGVLILKFADPTSGVWREWGRACLWAGTIALVIGLGALGPTLNL